VDALAQRGEEGRGQLRKASGSCKRATIRGYPNGGTRSGKPAPSRAEFIGSEKQTQGSEPSQYLKEEKETSISGVAASERERAQTGVTFG
jgi:hypothetical protein